LTNRYTYKLFRLPSYRVLVDADRGLAAGIAEIESSAAAPAMPGAATAGGKIKAQ
jgi:hypothetical protein